MLFSLIVFVPESAPIDIAGEAFVLPVLIVDIVIVPVFPVAPIDKLDEVVVVFNEFVRIPPENVSKAVAVS